MYQASLEIGRGVLRLTCVGLVSRDPGRSWSRVNGRRCGFRPHPLCNTLAWEEEPFHAATLYRRADAAWQASGRAARLRLHQARHTYASFMIAAGVNAKALSQFMGHSSIKVTFDLYGHLMPGSEREAAGMLDAFLERAGSQARLAAVSGE